MNFFEALRERAMDKPRGFFDHSPAGGIRATIEALKEMRVGEALVCEVEHRYDMVTYDEPMPVTDLYWGDGAIPWNEGHIGIDGEEVVVMVFKCEEKD